jgi:GMC oxidoreductase/FAD dependent oxidoreductase
MRLIEGPEAARELAADVCVVGSGPVGLCLALDLAERGLSVVLFESGLRRPNAEAQALSDAVVESPQRHAPMALAVCRALGGTSRLWGGRCVALDAIDFAPRDHVPDSGWPIAYADLAAFHGRASSLLGLGENCFVCQGSEWGSPSQGAALCHGREWWSNVPNIFKQLARRLKACPRLTVVLDATVVDLQIDATSDAVHGLVVAAPSQRVVFRAARCFVLALGGIETTRLLLNVQTRFPRLFGGAEGALGRYYMGHLSGSIADVRFRDPRLVRAFHYQRGTGAFARRLLMLDPAVQHAERLPNTSFYPANPRLGDASHRSGILSASYLALSAPILGSRLVAEAIRQGQTSGPGRYRDHLGNMLLDLPAVIGGAAEIARQALIDGRSKPLLFLPSKAGRHPLHFHAEQRPSRQSRVRLARDRDRLGLCRASIDLRFAEEDGAGIIRAHASLGRALEQGGIADLVYHHSPDERAAAVLAEARDGFHQIGSTRMAASPRAGVVDPDCRVFEFSNLFIAGSSVFPSSGQANPTFPAVALAVRLASYLQQRLKVGAPLATVQ